jgi:hypothetical protein
MTSSSALGGPLKRAGLFFLSMKLGLFTGSPQFVHIRGVFDAFFLLTMFLRALILNQNLSFLLSTTVGASGNRCSLQSLTS